MDAEVVIVRKYPYPQQQQEIVHIVPPQKGVEKDFWICTGMLFTFGLICFLFILLILLAFTPSVFEAKTYTSNFTNITPPPGMPEQNVQLEWTNKNVRFKTNLNK